MKNKLIFRILGALSSALIIVSVFVPYMKILNKTQSLWYEYTTSGAMYLPIMIIVFGAIPVILFSINKKIELVYSSVGALIFFLIAQTITIVNQGTFGNLNVGYYFLCTGTLLTLIMTFICNIRVKQKKEVVEQPKEESLLNQIDKLYGEQNVLNDELQNNNFDGIIQPIQIQSDSVDLQPISLNNNEQLSEVNEINNIPDVIPSEPIINNVEVTINNTANETLEQPQNNITPEIHVSNVNETIVNTNLATSNPVVSEFSAPILNNQQQVPNNNPALYEFSVPGEKVNNPIINTNLTSNNPVVSEYEGTLHVNNNLGNNNIVQPLSNNGLNSVVEEKKEESNLDIFS